MRDDFDRPIVEDIARTVRGHAVMVRLVGCNEQYELVPEDRLTSYSNYFKGKDQSQWKSRVPNYGRVIAKEVWPGIDVEYKADPRGVETLFHVKPGADASRIVVQYDGLDAPLRIDSEGNLVLVTSVGNLYEQAPFAYQIENRMQANIPVRYRLLGNNRYGLICEDYNRTAELMIDPLVYSTFFAGDGTDKVSGFAMDSQGNKIACGRIHPMRAEFPVTPGAFQTTRIGYPGWIAKLTPGADSILFATYVSGASSGGYLAIDGNNCIYYVCYAGLPDWPLTPDAFDTTASLNGDVGIIRLSPDGTTLQFGSFLGGDGQDNPYGAKLDSSGRLIIYGFCSWPTTGFPITPDAIFPMPTYSSGFLSIIEPTTSQLIYSTFLFPRRMPAGHNMSNLDIAFISESSVWICGTADTSAIITTPDALQPDPPPSNPWYVSFFSLLDLDAAQIVYSSLFYGPDPEVYVTNLRRLHAVDENRVLLCGYTNEPDIPMPPGGFQSEYPEGGTDVFLIEVERPQTLVHGTFFGGYDNGMTEPRKMHVAPDGSVVISAVTDCSDLPTTPDAFDSTFAGTGEFPYNDIVVARFSADLSELLYSTYLGGWDDESPRAMVYESGDSVWIAGSTYSWDYPLTDDALFTFDPGGFITCLTVPGEHNSVPNPFISHPSSFALSSFPNPFNPTATLSFTLPHSAPVTIGIYNVLGQTVYEENLGRLNAGVHSRLFDASELPSGVYLARVQAGEQSQIRKMMLLK